MIYVKIKDSHIIYNESKPAVLSHIAKVSKESVAPRFEKGDTQGRIEKQLNVISSIRDNFNSELMFGHEGSFQGIPIITYDGRVVSGNHRAEAIKTMQDECATRYISEVARHYGISISKDEMIVRLLPQGTADDVIKEMAYISNVGRESTLGERALINNVRYADGIASLPKYIQSESVDELQCIVARHLDKASNGLNIFDANLALFCDVVGIDTEGKGIMESFDKIHKRDPEISKKLKDLLVGNAGALWNIKNDDRVRNIELDKYLGRAVQVLAGTKGNKLQNAEALNKEIQSFLELTDAGRESALTLAPTLLDDFKAFALATALLKFVWQENPAGAFYDFLKDFIEILDNIVSPSLISEGKPLYEANIFDTIKIFLAQGKVNVVVSNTIKLMDKLEQLGSNAPAPAPVSIKPLESVEPKPLESIEPNPIAHTSKIKPFVVEDNTTIQGFDIEAISSSISSIKGVKMKRLISLLNSCDILGALAICSKLNKFCKDTFNRFCEDRHIYTPLVDYLYKFYNIDNRLILPRAESVGADIESYIKKLFSGGGKVSVETQDNSYWHKIVVGYIFYNGKVVRRHKVYYMQIEVAGSKYAINSINGSVYLF